MAEFVRKTREHRQERKLTIFLIRHHFWF
jgi:hypothetical protein